MDRAITETQLPPEIAALLREFFHGTTTFLMNRP